MFEYIYIYFVNAPKNLTAKTHPFNAPVLRTARHLVSHDFIELSSTGRSEFFFVNSFYTNWKQIGPDKNHLPKTPILHKTKQFGLIEFHAHAIHLHTE